MSALAGNQITANGTYTVPTIPGVRYLVAVSGDFGGGSLAINWKQGSTSTAYPNSPATAAEAWTITAAADTLELVLSEATDPAITITAALADGLAIDNTAVTAAIAENPEAAFTALMAGGTVPPVNQVFASLDYDPSGANNGLRFVAADGGSAGNQLVVALYEHSSVVIDVIDGNTILIGYVPNVTTAGQIIAEFNEILAALNLMSVDNLPASSGLGTLPEGGLVETNLSGGIDATEGFLGCMKVDADHLYVVASVTNGAPLWKKIALTAL